MTQDACYTAIRETITAHGFQAGTTWNSQLPCIVEDGDTYFGLTIYERTTDLTCHEGGATGRVALSFQGRIRKMGGEPTPNELLRAADEIQRGANLVIALEALTLDYAVCYGKGEYDETTA